MKTVGNIIIGKAAITGTTFKVDGKKYKLTEKFSGILEKLDLEGRTAAFYLNKDGDIDGVQLNGVYIVRGVEVPSYKEEGTTYKASYIVALGTACNLKEGRPFRFSVATRNKDNESVFYECKTWDDVAERAAVELAVPDGEKKPRVWVVARASKHNGRDQYTVEDYGVISD